MANLKEKAVTRLATISGVDLNSATPNALYTVPPGRSCVVKYLVQRAASVNLTTASWSAGWNAAAYDDVLADATHTELVDDTVFTVLAAKAGSKLGIAGDVLKLLANTLQGSAATITVDVFGYWI